jgi:hypothetical protein
MIGSNTAGSIATLSISQRMKQKTDAGGIDKARRLEKEDDFDSVSRRVAF